MFRLLDAVAAVTCGHAVAAATDDGVPQLRLRACFCTIVSQMTSLVITRRVLGEDRIVLLDYCGARRCYSVQGRSSVLGVTVAMSQQLRLRATCGCRN